MRKKPILSVSLVLFLILFLLVSKINFFQNDDWVYYEMVSRFMHGDFTLHPYSGPTFYTQGLIGAAFSFIFGLTKLPILTLIFSVANFYLFTRYVKERLGKSLKLSLLLGLIYFFNPLNIYLILGFMTSQYFIFFMLTSLWFHSFYKESNDKKYLWRLIISIFLGLVVRQVSLFIPLGLAAFYLLSLNFKKAGLFTTIFVVFYYYYSNIFPLTSRIREIPLQLHHLFDFDYSFALVFGVLVVLTAYIFPVILSSINFKKFYKSKLKLILGLVLMVAIYFFANRNFNPHEISWGEFPYFENTLERTGFYSRGLGGTKYQFRWNYDLYYNWDLSSKVLLVAFIAYFLLYRLRVRDEHLTLAFVYLGMLIVTETFYDRYILVLIPLVLMFLAKNYIIENKLNHLLLSVFVIFLAFFSYQLGNDFVAINKYVWERSEELVAQGTSSEMIQGTKAWKLTHRNVNRDYLYNFSFDSQEVNEDYKNLYTLVEIKEIDFFGNIFVNPKVYLYKRN